MEILTGRRFDAVLFARCTHHCSPALSDSVSTRCSEPPNCESNHREEEGVAVLPPPLVSIEDCYAPNPNQVSVHFFVVLHAELVEALDDRFVSRHRPASKYILFFRRLYEI